MSGAPQVAQICAAVRAAIGEAPAALHEPEFAGNESRYLKWDPLESTCRHASLSIL